MAGRFLYSLSLSAIIVSASLSLAQSTAPVTRNSDPRNLDATLYGERVTLGPDWLFSCGDSLAWASPTFDDSGWRVVSIDKNLTDYGIHDSSHCWYRIHIQMRPGVRDLAIGILGTYGSYELYANGVRIADAGRITGLARFNRFKLTTIPVPDSLVASQGKLVLALRFALDTVGPTGPGTSSPLGPGSAVYLLSRESALREMSYVDAHNTADMWVLAGLSLLIGLVAIALYSTLRQQGEYLACAVFLLAESAYCFNYIHQELVANTTASQWIQYGSTGVVNVALIEFVRLVMRRRRTAWILILEIASFVSALFSPLGWAGYFSFYAGFITYYLPILIVLAVLLALLLEGWKQGNREAWVLLPAVLLRGLSEYWRFLSFVAYYTHITTRFRQPPLLHLGTYETSLRSCGGFVFFITMLLFLVLRTVVIARERANAAAELEAARNVQQILIPEEIPTVPGFAICSVYKPAGQVGGDFFQVLAIESRGVLVAIGDVSGKGMPAAMTVSLLVGAFRTLAHYTQSPGEILASMNQRMLARSNGGFTTCLVLRIDRHGEATIANAGHIAPYVAGKELPLENGLPLGLAADSTYAEFSYQFAPGQQMTLLTDGVVESRDKAGTLFGFERSAALSTEPAEAIASAAQAFGQDDDITVLTLSFAGTPVSV